ncbi:hypothetical protein BABINDRAFT_160708 [Babjeviella inositovora NRRL Y-12698]|uniref:B30.2/SPRY domain-containing protein n=1 Tax=Babjeviella inositovora NRRL Y-12698 TaxID=984486 RepID=A0A1E3QUI6_9ASCO|nr:uncharacterized protein BABINDRAFT_160708 [Babjeviella inositovora NRRL Y-12698]ODQ81351.1 hypothetical protein BABINDRAFT_160708 [Babjeviella inositovora NRRL Y-12698]
MDAFFAFSDEELADFLLGFSLALAGAGTVVLIVFAVYYIFFRGQSGIVLDASFNIPGQYDAERAREESEDEFLHAASPTERADYLRARAWCAEHPPVLAPIGASYDPETIEDIRLRGIDAFHFQPDPANGYTVVDKTDVVFHDSPQAASALLNYSLPVKTRPESECVYFEVKFLEFARGTASVGLATAPYPAFRLPGAHNFSLAYETRGTLRVNHSFASGVRLLPEVRQSDVVGVGFFPRTGTVFFTHNGRKVMDVARELQVDMYPCVGARGAVRLQVNVGRAGFVFIEANVKKWGFATRATIGAPPVYLKNTGDEVLAKGAELPPDYPEQEVTFFGPSALVGPSHVEASPVRTEARAEAKERIEAKEGSSPLSSPPSYKMEGSEVRGDERSDGSLSESERELRERLYEERSSGFTGETQRGEGREAHGGEEMETRVVVPGSALEVETLFVKTLLSDEAPVDVETTSASNLAPQLSPTENVIPSHGLISQDGPLAGTAVVDGAVDQIANQTLESAMDQSFSLDHHLEATPSPAKKPKNKKKGKKGKKGRTTF